MKGYIKPNRLSFKFGTNEWMNYFGLPTGLIVLSFIDVYFYLKDINDKKASVFLTSFILTFFVGIMTYKLQMNRLRFKTFKLTKGLDEFKEKTRELLVKEKWVIDYDNIEYIQATYRGNIFNLDMLTLRYKKNEIQWNVIHHPQSYNSIAALLSINRQGRRIIKIIKANA